MKRNSNKLPDRLKNHPTAKIEVYAEGGNEYFYLRASGALVGFNEGAPLQKPAIKTCIEAIKRSMANEAIEQIYWIIDGGDEHNQVKEFKEFYLQCHTNKASNEGETPYWSKLKILINHPCLEYWFLLHKCDPPKDPKTGRPRFFAYDRKSSPSPCNLLLQCDDFNQGFPTHSKGTRDKAFIKSIAENEAERNQAVKRAKALKQPTTIDAKTVLSYPCAEIYLLFEQSALQNSI